MELPLINIGNSKGICLPKRILDKYSIKDKFALILEKKHIILKPKLTPRKGWEEAFKKMSENGDDKPLMDDVFEEESFEEWNK